MKNKPILFIDFDGTICCDKYWRSLSLDKYKLVQNLIFGENKKYLNDWMLGKYTSEKVNEYVAKNIGIDKKILWKLFVKDCKTMHVSIDVFKKINKLRKKFIIILITINMDSFFRFVVPSLNLNYFFDYISSSHVEKKYKIDDDGELFMKYANKYKVNIKDCILIDNSQNVCDIFKNMGGKVFKITKSKNINYYLDILKKEC